MTAAAQPAARPAEIAASLISGREAPKHQPQDHAQDHAQDRTQDWPQQSPVLTLDGFVGPLERLLTLARAQQVDLASLSIGALVEQLAAALQHAPTTMPLGQKGDWVVMAAWLVQLRSLLLLPAAAPARQAAELEADQLRARLIELRAMQTLAGWLDRRPQLGQGVFMRGRPDIVDGAIGSPPPLDVTEFLWASLALFDDDLPALDTAARYQPRWWDLYPVAEARIRILQLLSDQPDGQPLDLLLPDTIDSAMPHAGSILRRRSAWTSTLIAGLELAKQGDVALRQGDFGGPILVRPVGRQTVPE